MSDAVTLAPLPLPPFPDPVGPVGPVGPGGGPEFKVPHLVPSHMYMAPFGASYRLLTDAGSNGKFSIMLIFIQCLTYE